MSSTIYSSTTGGISSADYTTETRTPKQELGKDEFLQILVVQMSNQDPLEPMEDTDFIAQMAQFSSLEQMQALNTTFTASQAYSMIGKNVVGKVDDGTQEGAYVLGRVTGVVTEGDTQYLQVGNYNLPLEAISEVYDTGMESNATVSQASNLVGRTVEASVPETVTDGVTGEAVTKDVTVTGEVTAILVKDGAVYANIKGVGLDKEVPVSYITKIS